MWVTASMVLSLSIGYCGFIFLSICVDVFTRSLVRVGGGVCAHGVADCVVWRHCRRASQVFKRRGVHGFCFTFFNSRVSFFDADTTSFARSGYSWFG
jgi:hypothetical protein